MEIPVNDIKPGLCPYCGWSIDAATHVTMGDVRPKKNDVAMCLSCGEAAVIEADLSLRKITAEDLASLPKRVRRLLERGRKLARERGPLPDFVEHGHV